MRNALLLPLFLILLQTAGLRGQSGDTIYRDPGRSIEERVADLLSRMTVEEKVAQMRIFHANQGVEGDEEGNLTLSENVKTRLTHGIAGIKNPGEHLNPKAAATLNNELQRYIIDHNRLGIPALFVTESYNGVDAAGSTVFGRPITSAASFNPELVHRQWDVVGREARLRGMHMCHSPEADLVRDPRFGRKSEAFGEDTYLVSRMVVAAITGVQGDYDGLGAGTHIGAVAKHFAGYGQILGGTNFAAIEISPRTLHDEILPPFRAAVQEARTVGIMASHGDLNGVASHANPWLLTEVLRDEWGFEGYTVSDANDIGRLFYFMKVAESPEAAAEMALRAGMDVDLYADDAYSLLPAMVGRDSSLVANLDRAAGHVLRTKFILGLFDDPYADVAETEAGVRAAASLALARESDEESIILLKNEANTLPLARAGQRIALLGPLVNETTEAAFAEVAGAGVTLVSDAGFELTDGAEAIPVLNDDTAADVDRLVELARDADVVVLFLGGDEHTAKEGFFNGALGDRLSIDPVGPQDELIRRVKELGKPVVVCLLHRRTLSVNAIAESADAILDGWDLSEFRDASLARVIFGDVNPSGKLPVTVPRSIGQLPFHYAGKEINNKKGYLFTENGPLYPFGHGLSYTTFEYGEPVLSDTTLTAEGSLTVSVDVTNTGSRSGREVVQWYLKDQIGSVTRPDMELKSFEKITLEPGETKTVTFTVTPDLLAFTRLDMTYGPESGTCEVRVGPSSADFQSRTFQLVTE
ncbi:glycoside hydrolase family 3 N-terminal domain-containing protein [Lewinella sp. IMCC34191]|uniref:glycoside hydrolase family 3 N-terminal domain-containing protein n=1 Tax=Lewinella sp. IMCC34191 TaxID=2259172 RepID=UPI000E261053|nr:glycoside hydrolase family 3 N-terminal domain-containing protein [Lewinella sp. IMCC34191]